MSAGALHALAWAKSVTHDTQGVRLTPAEKLCLLVLADYQGPAGYAWPSVDRLADECAVSHRQVQKIIARLEQGGLLNRQPRYTDKGQTSNAYRLHVGAVAEPQQPAGSKVTASTVRDGLIEVMPYIVADHETPTSGFVACLAAADALASDHADLSDDIVGYLRNTVLAHAALEAHNIDFKGATRLFKEAKALGRDGHKWLIASLFSTSSADVSGDPTSYVIKVARNKKAEAAS
jgi:hypothetical protein